MRPIAILLEYDGANYVGWQNQPKGDSVQKTIEVALGKAFGIDADIVGSGRTDAGVHARGQVAHVHLMTEANNIPLDKVSIAINTHLPRDIRVCATSDVDESFHARFNAISREYIYVIAKKESVFSRYFSWTPDLPFDPARLAEAVQIYEGQHDFTAVSKLNHDTRSYVCLVDHCQLEEHSDRFVIRIRANRFVYGMCRGIVGAALTIARGKIDLDTAREMLASGSRDGQAPLAPSHGLILNRVRYANGIFDDQTFY
ncbi:MAG: tRNA pseudouridine(38-40) synthase TruA [Candidatus Kapabacteria bacterium]|nr:tRNA pseudouridine(38-40) synthase TruA [Candidatus Kapabacteria bacterium]